VEASASWLAPSEAAEPTPKLQGLFDQLRKKFHARIVASLALIDAYRDGTFGVALVLSSQIGHAIKRCSVD
jgi:hypothetical protein